MPEKHNFLDSRTLFAAVLVIGILIGWQNYMSKKYPVQKTPVAQEEKPPAQEVAMKTEKKPEQPSVFPSFEHYENEILSFDLSNRGMGLHNIVVKQYKDRKQKEIILGSSEAFGAFETRLLGKEEPLFFVIKKSQPHQYVGEAHYGDLKIIKEMTINPSLYTVDVKLQLSGMQRGVSGIETMLVENLGEELENGDSFFLPSFDTQAIYFDIGSTSQADRLFLELPKIETGQFFREKINKEKISNVAVAAMERHYFASAVLDNSPVQPELVAHYEGVGGTKEMKAIGRLVYVLPSGKDHLNLSYSLFTGPKSFDLLKEINPRLTQLVDFGYGGWLDWLAYPLFRLMKWLYSLTLNYGMAIILLTIIVRFLVMPFTVMSLRSMKRMQVYQPQIKALREKYKDDPKTQQMEMMNFFKEHKINPIGGCLPMLLQMPVFFALYRVLYQSIELYQAPFALWISDLSLKDPFYVLPILMGATLFIQQKLTPTTMDPAQAKVMMFMPIIFSLFMLSLPSGLNLYIFVSTLFGIVQHMVFMRDTKKRQTV